MLSSLADPSLVHLVNRPAEGDRRDAIGRARIHVQCNWGCVAKFYLVSLRDSANEPVIERMSRREMCGKRRNRSRFAPRRWIYVNFGDRLSLGLEANAEASRVYRDGEKRFDLSRYIYIYVYIIRRGSDKRSE